MCYNGRMNRRYGKKKFFKHRSVPHSTGIGSIFKVIFYAFGIMLAVCVVSLIVMISLEAVFKIDTPIKQDGFVANSLSKMNLDGLLICSPTPYITPEPTVAPKPMDDFDGGESEKEIVLPSEMSYTWFGSPYYFSDKIIYPAGKLVNGKSLMVALLEYNLSTESVRELKITSQNGQLLNPVFNENWLIYLDGKTSNGGGDICIIDLKSGSMTPKVIKTVYACQPEFKLGGDYVTWIERTGTSKDKLFVCYIPTCETTVIDSFTNSSYGTSMPFINSGCVVWSNDDNIAHDDGKSVSVLKSANLENGTITEFYPGTYIHDPEFNGSYYVWLDSAHTENCTLYVYNGYDEPVAIDSGVVEFAITDKYIAYGKDEAVWVYLFSDGSVYRITPDRETAQFLNASDRLIMWMDVTSRDRDIIRYVELPEL